jgi:hypothetical protein
MNVEIGTEAAQFPEREYINKTDFPCSAVFILIPSPRFVRFPCCDNPEYITTFTDPDFLSTILGDLTKLRYTLRSSVHPATVVDSFKLVYAGTATARKKLHRL